MSDLTARILSDLSGSIPFGGNPLDRCDALRPDAAVIAAFAADPAARALLLAGETVLVDPVAGAAGVLQAMARVPEGAERVFLGRDPAGAPRFAADLAGLEPADLVPMALRALASDPAADPGVLGMVAQARGVLAWHGTHQFCARCGQPTVAAMAGTRRVCTACAAEHFPRTDPVVIMLVHDGSDVLLGRAHRFQPNFFSTLAGFMEPGETIEAAVRREVMEETGIRVGRVRYVACQPWPFPSSLMMGCLAEALSRDITLDPHEMADARWVSAAELAAMLDGTHPDGLTGPKPLAIAHHLMRAHLDGQRATADA
ncbi:NAD(+) diphosphatase [Segnochrobactraceae bacterium EtOH-i3]